MCLCDTHVTRARMRRCTIILTTWVLLYMASTLVAAQPMKESQAYEELQRKYEAALQEIGRLRRELKTFQGERTAATAPPPGAAERAPGDAPLQVGNAHLVAQRYAEAVAAYTQAIEMAPRDARAYKHRGLAHAKLGNAQQAYKDLSKAIELEPQDGLVYNQRGIA